MKISTVPLHYFACQRNWVFIENSDFLIPIFFPPDGVNLWYFKLFSSNRIYSLKYLRSKALGCKDIGIEKSKFVTKTQFLYPNPLNLYQRKKEVKYMSFQSAEISTIISKVLMQGKLVQRCTHFLYCSVLSLGGKVNTRRMSQPDMESIFTKII